MRSAHRGWAWHNVEVDTERAAIRLGIQTVKSSEHAGEPRIHRALPSLRGRLVINLDEPVAVTYGDQTITGQAVLVGLMRPGVAGPTMTLQPVQRTIYVELSAAAFQQLAGAPLKEFDAGGVDAASALRWITSLVAETAEQTTHWEREELVRNRLLHRLTRAPQADRSDSLIALELLRQCDGGLSTPELARRLHLSERQLRHVMARDIGVGPKFAARIARFSGALRSAAAGAPTWSAVAASAGFYDQSHLVEQFQALMGTTPTQWLLEERRNLQGWRHLAG